MDKEWQKRAPIYELTCPKCSRKWRYKPRYESTVLNTATSQCPRCKSPSLVLVHGKLVVKQKKKIPAEKSTSPKTNTTSTKPKPTTKAKSKASTSKAANAERLLPSVDPGFFMFARWFSIPAYKGLHNWQKEHHNLTWHAPYDMTLVPRDHGKSVAFTIKYEWAMQYKDFDVLLLGWTDRRKEVAMYVYSFFAIHDLIVQDKRTSPFHFRLKNGGKFDCYLITSKETLGMHSEGDTMRFSNITEAEWNEFKKLFKHDIDKESEQDFSEKELREYIESRKGTTRKLWISIDDPIDISFMKERHKEESLELHFRSSLYPIHPDKWSFTGTCKFEEDFFHFIRMTFGNLLVEYKRGTRNHDGSLLCPERFTARDQPTYEEDIKDYYIADGQKIGKKPKRDLDLVRKHVGEYAWWSEYEQEPHPITGEVWDHIEYELMLDTPINRKYDLLIITVDRATTMNISSDYTGCVLILRETKTGNRIVIEDWTDNIRFDDLLMNLNDYIVEFHRKHPEVTIVIVVEKQGGGDDFITLAKNLKVFVQPDGSIVKNMIPEIAVIEEVHNIGEKLSRIKERLFAPIKNAKLLLLKILKGCELEKEILSFPYPARLDAIDATANAEFFILDRYPLSEFLEGGVIDQIKMIYKRVMDKQQEAKEAAMRDIIEIEEDSKTSINERRKYVFD